MNKKYISLLFLPVLISYGSSEDEIEELIISDPDPIPVTTVHSVISFDNPGKLIDVFFYDVKQSNKAVTSSSMAKEIFSIDGVNGIRIPIWGTAKYPAHPSEGVVVEEQYASVLNSIRLAKEARNGKEFQIFASKKLQDQTSFPDWVKNSDGIIPEKYAILIADFLEFMKSKNIQIDYLGIDNEFVYNEGNITPQKYHETISELRVLANDRGFEAPKLVGYDDYGPNKRNWVKTLMDNGWGDTMDIYGTHYYPQWRPKSKLLADLALIGDRPFWSTEPHWDNKSEVDDLEEAEAGIVTFWDQIDVGMTGFIWWSYSIGDNLRGKLMRAVSAPMLGARPIKITDVDGEGIETLGKLQTRAFIEDKTITVYAVNMNDSKSYEDYTFKIEGSSINGNISAKHWNVNTSVSGQVKILNSFGDDNDMFTFSIPKRSITRFTITIN